MGHNGVGALIRSTVVWNHGQKNPPVWVLYGKQFDHERLYRNAWYSYSMPFKKIILYKRCYHFPQLKPHRKKRCVHLFILYKLFIYLFPWFLYCLSFQGQIIPWMLSFLWRDEHDSYDIFMKRVQFCRWTRNMGKHSLSLSQSWISACQSWTLQYSCLSALPWM